MRGKRPNAASANDWAALSPQRVNILCPGPGQGQIVAVCDLPSHAGPLHQRPADETGARDVARGRIEEVGVQGPESNPEGYPHDHLYTRLQASPGKGVGVFAIRDIPAGLDPFRGEAGETVMIPCAEIDRLEDRELRRFYLDFCPVVDGHFEAPVNFNQMTIAWYLNHSDTPNVVCGEAATFATKTLIRRGEELTVDYTTFSAHAETYARAWRDGTQR